MKFTSIFFSVSLVLFSLLYGLIVAVDPYNKLGNNFFNLETKAVDFARENKFTQIEYSPKSYEAFIIGSSTAHRFETQELEKLTGFKSYNYAVQSATPEDYLAITRHILSKKTPKMVVFFPEFYGMNKEVEADDMFYSSPLKNYLNGDIETKTEEADSKIFKKSYVTTAALNDTFKVLFVNLFGKPKHTYLEDGDHIYEKFEIGKAIPVTQYSYPNFTLSAKRESYLREMKRLLSEKGVKIVVITSPLSFEHLRMIDNDPYLKTQFLAFKNLMTDIFEEIYDINDLKMMSEYNSSEFYFDSNHPTFEFSRTILKDILGTEKEVSRLHKKRSKGNVVEAF